MTFFTCPVFCRSGSEIERNSPCSGFPRTAASFRCRAPSRKHRLHYPIHGRPLSGPSPYRFCHSYPKTVVLAWCGGRQLGLGRRGTGPPVPWQALIYECLLFDMDMFLSTRIYAPDRSQQGKCRVRAPTKPHGLVCFGWHGRVLAFSTPQGLLLPAPRIVRDSFLAPPLGPKVSPRSTSLRGLAPA